MLQFSFARPISTLLSFTSLPLTSTSEFPLFFFIALFLLIDHQTHLFPTSISTFLYHSHPSLSHDPVKKLKLLSLPDKPCEIFVFLARISLLLCLISSILLVLHITFSPAQARTNWLRFPSNPNRTGLDPQPSPTNLSHILFGIGGAAATWRERSRYTSIWWNPNLTRGFAWLDKHPGETAPSPPYRISSAEWTRFKYVTSRPAVRIARIVSDSFRLGAPGVRWFVMGDDDTVFFAENLAAVLGKYDHRQMWYVGGNSESVEQDVMHAYDMAFGGGGFAISYPLAERLVSLMDGCLDRYFSFYGSDQRIWACLSEIGVGLTREVGFHQFDIRGNPYGLLAAHPQAPLVSLHHLEYLDPLFPNKNQIDSVKSLHDAYRVDPPRILQQTFCHDTNRKWSLSIAWGYTVQLYPSLLAAKDLQRPLQTFKTWRTWSNGPFTFNTRPMPSDPCEQPVVFMLEQAEEVEERGSLTSYKRVKTKAENTCNRTEYAQAMSVQRIVISSIKLDPGFWTKAPRRQCCEFIDKGSIKSSGLKIRIRKCRSWETVTA